MTMKNAESAEKPTPEELIKSLDHVNRRLSAVQTRWEALFQAAPDPIIIGDEEGILVCNPRVEDLKGLSSEKIVGTPLAMLPLCITDMDACSQLIHYWTHPSEQGGRFPFRFLTPDGKEVILDMQIRFVKMENVTLRFCIGRDVTHEHKLFKEHQIAVAQIDKNMAQLAALNDEIRNPLTLISMSAGLMDGPHQEQVMKGVRMINTIVDRLDQGFTESEKVRKFLKRTIDGFMEEQMAP